MELLFITSTHIRYPWVRFSLHSTATVKLHKQWEIHSKRINATLGVTSFIRHSKENMIKMRDRNIIRCRCYLNKQNKKRVIKMCGWRIVNKGCFVPKWGESASNAATLLDTWPTVWGLPLAPHVNDSSWFLIIRIFFKEPGALFLVNDLKLGNAIDHRCPIVNIRRSVRMHEVARRLVMLGLEENCRRCPEIEVTRDEFRSLLGLSLGVSVSIVRGAPRMEQWSLVGGCGKVGDGLEKNCRAPLQKIPHLNYVFSKQLFVPITIKTW